MISYSIVFSENLSHGWFPVAVPNALITFERHDISLPNRKANIGDDVRTGAFNMPISLAFIILEKPVDGNKIFSTGTV